ncbi:MAG: rod shape-determining protein RodA [Desulfovibrionaceae bacterium]
MLHSTENSKFLSQLNWTVVISVALLSLVGLINLYSASGIRTEDEIVVNTYFQRQILWGCLGIICMVLVSIINYRHFYSIAIPFFVFTVLLLAAVPVVGKTVYGAKRWISLGFMNIQPSELAKISILILGAKLLSKGKAPMGWKELLFVAGIASIPAMLVLSQPDLGTTICMLAILGGIIIFRGIRIYVVRVLLVFVPMLLPVAWMFLHDYQKQRILTFINPGKDPLGSGYHVIQSQIAFGSGGFWGSGFLSGSQSQLRFLPEKHTDFALAVFGEEWGFIGMVILLILFCVFLYGIYYTAKTAKDRFGSYLTVGVFFYFFSQITVNMGMVLGIMPVVGIPLPFISYGGTATIVNFVFIGIVLNVSMRRFVFKVA